MRHGSLFKVGSKKRKGIVHVELNYSMHHGNMYVDLVGSIEHGGLEKFRFHFVNRLENKATSTNSNSQVFQVRCALVRISVNVCMGDDLHLAAGMALIFMIETWLHHQVHPQCFYHSFLSNIL